MISCLYFAFWSQPCLQTSRIAYPTVIKDMRKCLRFYFSNSMKAISHTQNWIGLMVQFPSWSLKVSEVFIIFVWKISSSLVNTGVLREASQVGKMILPHWAGKHLVELFVVEGHCFCSANLWENDEMLWVAVWGIFDILVEYIRSDQALEMYIQRLRLLSLISLESSSSWKNWSIELWSTPPVSESQGSRQWKNYSELGKVFIWHKNAWVFLFEEIGLHNGGLAVQVCAMCL